MPNHNAQDAPLSEMGAAAWGWAIQHGYVPGLSQLGQADGGVLELLCADTTRHLLRVLGIVIISDSQACLAPLCLDFPI